MADKSCLYKTNSQIIYAPPKTKYIFLCQAKLETDKKTTTKSKLVEATIRDATEIRTGTPIVCKMQRNSSKMPLLSQKNQKHGIQKTEMSQKHQKYDICKIIHFKKFKINLY